MATYIERMQREEKRWDERVVVEQGNVLEFKKVEASNGEDKDLRDKGAEWQWGSKGGGMGLGRGVT
ncbi:hypothetical protein C4D60_Mb11t01030 [Musa balbisiana]|uniref:Uncharacterized protein n=1 Tax=Musa balbisiana TaxID=52838 RepID=A0A4S8J0U1_MUSBA|nr:hypothetical protein C4D60_Mb11t01030 [Musa balbisiana]